MTDDLISRKAVMRMTTDELVQALRENVAWGYSGDLMLKAADRLEELDERVAIMTEPGTDPACEPDGASPNPVPTAGR